MTTFLIVLAEGGIAIDNQTLLILLGTGGVASLAAFGRAMVAFRNSAEARESKAIRNLERWRDQADERALKCFAALEGERAMTSYWSARCAAREYQLAREGVDLHPYAEPPPPPPTPVPPPGVDIDVDVE